MKKAERQAAILHLLQKQEEVHTSTICRLYDIVEMTVRRDFMEMEERGEIIRTHGGAIAIEKKTSDAQTPLQKRLKMNTDKKQELALCARSFLEVNDKIFIASGSTLAIFAQSLLHYLPLSIITTAINVVYQLSNDPKLHLHVLGGELKNNALTLSGAVAELNLHFFQIKKAFISVNAIDKKGHLYTSSVVESTLLKELFLRAGQVYVVADSSKLNKKDLVAIEHKNTYVLITDKDADTAILDAYKKQGIQVVLA